MYLVDRLKMTCWQAIYAFLILIDITKVRSLESLSLGCIFDLFTKNNSATTRIEIFDEPYRLSFVWTL
jgi:hypothetical protein